MQRTAWLLIVGLVLSMLVLAAEAHASAARVRLALGRLPVFKDDVAAPGKSEQLDAIAAAVSQQRAPEGVARADWQALLLAVGYAESGYSLRIGRGECRQLECDRGRARSYWQLHSNLHTAGFWDRLVGDEFVQVQARVASSMLQRAYWLCRNANVPWQQGTLSAYAGRRCDANWTGLTERLVRFAQIRKVL